MPRGALVLACSEIVTSADAPGAIGPKFACVASESPGGRSSSTEPETAWASWFVIERRAVPAESIRISGGSKRKVNAA